MARLYSWHALPGWKVIGRLDPGYINFVEMAHLLEEALHPGDDPFQPLLRQLDPGG
jgi:hypothetical protein